MYGDIFMRIVPDTSVIIDGRITSLIKEGEYTGATITIPEAVIAELESQANNGREIGFSGLNELQELQRLAVEGTITLEYVGNRPSLEQVKLANGGEIDALIRGVALEYDDARFITSDVVQSEVARAKGIDVLYLRPQIGDLSPLYIDQFFDENTVAVYLKERTLPLARKGTLQKAQLETIREHPLSEPELKQMAQEIVERAKRDPDGFIEVEKKGITVVQIGSLRITIARRPFSDGMEITAVRPTVFRSLDDYKYADLIRERLAGNRHGILIAGVPGTGKTTFAQSLAMYLFDQGCQVRTMEAPRDLQVPDQITQYAQLEGSMENTAEVLMLIRPDVVFFDEVRNDEDFRVFTDLRLAGLGMVGVVPGKSAQDAVCRFLERVDFGLLPRTVDTVIFVNQGEVAQVYNLSFSIKEPAGFGGEIGARPVISLTGLGATATECEIFRYEGETIALPVDGELQTAVQTAPVVVRKPSAVKTVSKEAVIPVEIPTPTPELAIAESTEKAEEEPAEEGHLSWKLAERDVEREIGRFSDGPVTVAMQSENKAVVYIDDRDVPAAIGKGGKNVAGIVNKLSIGIDIRPRSELDNVKIRDNMEPVPVPDAPPEESNAASNSTIVVNGENVVIHCLEYSGKIVDVFAGKVYLVTATVTDSGDIELAKNMGTGQELIKRHRDGEEIRVCPV